MPGLIQSARRATQPETPQLLKQVAMTALVIAMLRKEKTQRKDGRAQSDRMWRQWLRQQMAADVDNILFEVAERHRSQYADRGLFISLMLTTLSEQLLDTALQSTRAVGRPRSKLKIPPKTTNEKKPGWFYEIYGMKLASFYDAKQPVGRAAHLNVLDGWALGTRSIPRPAALESAKGMLRKESLADNPIEVLDRVVPHHVVNTDGLSAAAFERKLRRGKAKYRETLRKLLSPKLG